MELGTSFPVNCLNSERDKGRENYLLELSLTRLAAALNHEPPSISFYLSNVDGVVRYHLKKVMFQDFLM